MPAENIFNEPAKPPIRQSEFINEPFEKKGLSWKFFLKIIKAFKVVKDFKDLKIWLSSRLSLSL